jgi:hypothetical protein
MDQKYTFKQRTRYYLVLCHVLAETRKSRTRSVRYGVWQPRAAAAACSLRIAAYSRHTSSYDTYVARARADILEDILGYFVHLLHQSDIL